MTSAIPIFAFHRVGPRANCRFTLPVEVFERYLSVIAEEGYSTLTCSDLVSIVLGRAAPPPRACLLTFDDGCADVWVYAVPLLKRHRMRATVFVILNRLQSSGGTRPTLEDVWSRRCRTEELYQLPELRRVNANSLDNTYTPATDHISAEEARAMVGLGVSDMQSHGVDHGVHYTSGRLTGFLSPQSHWTALAAARGDNRLGTPIYETSSVLVRPRYCDPQPIRDRLASVVADSGDASFFRRPDWSAILQQEFDAASALVGVGHFESDDAWRATVFNGLRTCIRKLSELTGSEVQTLAWPFGSSSEQSQEVALQAGFALALTTRGGGYVPGVPRGGVGRISLKDHDAEQFRLALLRHSDVDYVRQQHEGKPSDGPLAIVV